MHICTGLLLLLNTTDSSILWDLPPKSHIERLLHRTVYVDWLNLSLSKTHPVGWDSVGLSCMFVDTVHVFIVSCQKWEMHRKGRRQNDVRSFHGIGPSSRTVGCSVPGAGISGHRHQRQVRSTQQVSNMMKVLKINNAQLKGGKSTMPKTMPTLTAAENVHPMTVNINYTSCLTRQLVVNFLGTS